MQPNPDPKPGRWILPVVILAMMGFAWLFINAADDPTVSATDTTRGGSSTATTTTSVAPAATTTTTALPADAVQYNLDITAAGLELAGLQERVIQTNTDWEARVITYPDTLAALQGLEREARDWRTGIDGIVRPTSIPEYTQFHGILAAAATEVNKTITQVIVGLQAPDSGEARQAAMVAFNQAVTGYADQVNAIAAWRPL